MFTDEQVTYILPWIIKNDEMRAYAHALFQILHKDDIAKSLIVHSILYLAEDVIKNNSETIDTLPKPSEDISQALFNHEFTIPSEEEEQIIGAWLKRMVNKYQLPLPDGQETAISIFVAMMGAYLGVMRLNAIACQIILGIAVTAASGHVPTQTLLDYKTLDGD